MTGARVAFLGLGEMGRRMAARLERRGHRVVVWNRSEGPAAAFAHTAPTPRDAAERADLVLLMVTDAAAVGDVTRDLPERTPVVDMSTSGVACARALGERFATVCDAPVGGSLSEAENGTLAVYAGGTAAAVDLVEPVLRDLGTVHRMGPLGSGQAVKVIGNMLMLCNVAALGEALRMAAAAGLDPERTLAALDAGPGSSRAVRTKGPGIVAGAFGPPARFPVRLAHKDLRLALEMGGGEFAALAERLLERAEAEGRGDQDYSTVAAT